ncbi:MAG: hypothetical protein NC930_03815, partial [Candidatus Omnitrophica bacterium]|nr:hypothetical protein [Candidatus Omnitrophota bacterium]
MKTMVKLSSLASWVVLFFFACASCLSPAAYADPGVSLDPLSGRYVPVQSLDEANRTANPESQDSLIQETADTSVLYDNFPLSPPSERHETAYPVESAIESSEFIRGSELQPVDAVVIDSLFHAVNQPPETSFLTRVSDGVYTMEFDDYFKSLLSSLLDPSLTAGFTPEELVNLELTAVNQRLQENLGGLFDFVTFFPTAAARDSLANFHLLATQNDGVPLGFGAPVKTDIEGIGFVQDDPLVRRLNETFGPRIAELFSGFMEVVSSRGKLEGLSWVDLPAISKYGTGAANFTDFVLLQEIAHRWGVFLSSGGRKGADPLGILGRDGAHWSPFFDAGNSPMDGIDWRDNGDGTFTMESFWGLSWFDMIFNETPKHINWFNDFDLYAMGLLAPSSVHASFVIENPRHPNGTALTDENFLEILCSSNDASFFLHPTIQGTRRDVTIQDIIQIEGPRNPSAEDAQTQKHFSIAMVVLK